jgi:hypothetical protein
MLLLDIARQLTLPIMEMVPLAGVFGSAIHGIEVIRPQGCRVTCPIASKTAVHHRRAGRQGGSVVRLYKYKSRA